MVVPSPGDHIVAVLGPTGCGKSTFIANASGQGHEFIGHGLRTCTTNVRPIQASHPKNQKSVVFVDTPGFDATSKSDVETLSHIAEWLTKTYQENVSLSTIIYLHRISDNRMTGSLLTTLLTFANLCGQAVMPNVIIATTMWDEVGEEKALLRQKELEESFWKDMLDSGCTTKQFKNTPESAWDIVDSKMTDGLKLNLLLQEEMGRHGKPINETSAFQSLKEEGLPRLFLGLLKIRIGRKRDGTRRGT